MVTWVDYSQGVGGATGDTSGLAVKAQVFAADGTKIDDEILVNTAIGGYQIDPQITALSNGGFVVTWGDGDYNSPGSGTLGDSSGASIKAQVFAADGTKIGTEFLVNASTYGHQIDPQIAALSNGDFVVSWSDLGGDVSGTGYAIRAQVFTADGTKIGEELVVDIGNQANSAEITALPNGTFVVTWIDHVGDFEATISAQVFTAGGDKIGSTSSVSHADISSSHQITPLLHTGFVVTWEDKVVTNEGYSWAVKAQVFAADGTKIGDEILVNTATASDQWDPNIAALSSSDFVVTWSSYDLPNGQSDIRGNLLSLPDIVNDTATTNEDTPVNIQVLANNFFEGTPAITATTNGSHGTVAVNNNGTPGNTVDDFVLYTPAPDFNGTDSFTYTVTSGGVTETATASVTVIGGPEMRSMTARRSPRTAAPQPHQPAGERLVRGPRAGRYRGDAGPPRDRRHQRQRHGRQHGGRFRHLYS